jgi:hypothetical protein
MATRDAGAPRPAGPHPARADPEIPANVAIATALESVAELLEEQRANPYRVQAYRGAARTIRGHPESMASILAAEGLEGLDRLPGIGSAIARAVRELVHTGRLGLLDRLRGDADPTALLASVPGIGPVLARRIQDAYGIETLEELEVAAHDGRLARVEGIGAKRLGGVVDALAGRFGRRSRRRRAPAELPPVAELLDVDREYRERARTHRLPRIAPRRFNPGGRSWLPIMHAARGDRGYTALFSNSALAHRVGRTDDWVVVYFDGGAGERQCTVVTERTGALAGRRVVRGREDECLALYESQGPAAPAPERQRA